MSTFVINRDQMLRAVARLRAVIEHVPGSADAPLEIDDRSMLGWIRATFSLTAFECDVLALAAAPELDGSFAKLLATACGDPDATVPTFSFALATLPNPAWSALRPESSLRRWRLVSVATSSITTGGLRVPEPLLHALLGFEWSDDSIRPYVVDAALPDFELSESQSAVVTHAAATLRRSDCPVISLVSGGVMLGRVMATAVARACGRGTTVIRSSALPTSPSELTDVLTLLERNAIMAGSVNVLEYEPSEDNARARIVETIVESVTKPLIVVGQTRLTSGAAVIPSFETARASMHEQAVSWSSALSLATVTPESRRLAAQFDLDLAKIHAVVAAAGDSPSFDALWSAARMQARPRLDSLAERVETDAGWRDLVLPAERRETLRGIVDAVRHRDRVFREWGFDRGASEAHGMTVLFTGPSGTGKTMAAKVLARALRLDLYRIDLAVVFSKYIGETEKNLRRIFDAAEAGGIVLLFDEADALFGKRSDVKDSHDRHANVEVSYLLQRLERFNGVAVLTSNLRDAFDNAFLRRFNFVLEFPFPDEKARARIWRHVFPTATPTSGLDFSQLAKLALPGGNIYTIARNAAVRAAARNRPVTMRDLAGAARVEYTKMGHGQGGLDIVRLLEAV